MDKEKKPVEIERKWIVSGWPEGNLPVIKDQLMRQGYISVDPTVRIREEKSLTPEKDDLILCFKSHGTLKRKEIEFPIERKYFEELEDLIGLPLIPKTRKTFLLPDGHHLEVNHVDEGAPTQFWYAEVEFPTEEEALSFDPAAVGLGDYLSNDVTGDPGETMGAYWVRTRKTKN